MQRSKAAKAMSQKSKQESTGRQLQPHRATEEYHAASEGERKGGRHSLDPSKIQGEENLHTAWKGSFRQSQIYW